MRMKKLNFNIILKHVIDDERCPKMHVLQKSIYHNSKQLDTDMIKFNQNKLKLVVAMCREKIDDQISCVSNKETLKGVVVFCEQKAVDDVDFVVKESFNAIAVIVRIQPQVDFDLPVLVLSEEEFI